MKKKLTLSASTMMWSIDITITKKSKSQLELTVVEESGEYRREIFYWNVNEPPMDFVTQAGKALLEIENWHISGKLNEDYDTSTDIDDIFLYICWYSPNYGSLGKFLTHLYPKQRKNIHTVFGSFFNKSFTEIFYVILEYMEHEHLGWEDIIEEFGIPTQKKSWEDIKSKIESRIENKINREKINKSRSLKRKFGDPDFIINFDKVLEKFGRKVPPGHLLHMTKFPAPGPGKLSDELLMAWGHLKKKIPSYSNEINIQIPISFTGQEDIIFAKWILAHKKSEKIERIKMLSDPDAVIALTKLRKISFEGKGILSRSSQNQASATYGKAIARLKASLDPD